MVMDPEIIGFIAGGLSSSLFIPQIVKIVREKSAQDISIITSIIGVISTVLWLIYGCMNSHLSMIVTNSIALVATVLLFGLKLKYGDKSAQSQKK